MKLYRKTLTVDGGKGRRGENESLSDSTMLGLSKRACGDGGGDE